MLKRLFTWLFGDRKSDIELILEHHRESEERYHEHISQLIGTLDRVVGYKRERQVSDVKQNEIRSPLPPEMLSDVLDHSDDREFIAAASQAFN